MPKTELPFEIEEKVIEVSQRHIFLAFGLLTVTALGLGMGLIVVKDYTRYRRQKVLLDNIRELIVIVQSSGKESNGNQTDRGRSVDPAEK